MIEKRGIGRCISRRMPIARWVETGVEGSTLAIRLQRPFVMLRDIPKKIKQILRRCLKISYISNGMYDIIEPALAIRFWQCQGSGD